MKEVKILTMIQVFHERFTFNLGIVTSIVQLEELNHIGQVNKQSRLLRTPDDSKDVRIVMRRLEGGSRDILLLQMLAYK